MAAVGSTLDGKEDLLLSGLKLVLSDPNNKVLSSVLCGIVKQFCS